MKKKRVLIIADTHCGHRFGLCPPQWWAVEQTESDRLQKHSKFQRQLWEFYAGEIEKLKPIDILVANGDLIEGKGERTGGIELITSDRHEQVRMARTIIDLVEAKSVRITYGTAYHVGKEEDFESLLRDSVSCPDVKISGHHFLDVNGCVFDIKHKIGRSTIPHGRITPLVRAAMWNTMWAARDRQPQARIVIRSHVHYYEKWENDQWTGIITPALQYNTIYGIRDCEGIVNIGLIYVDVEGPEEFNDQCILAKFDALIVRAESV